MAHTEGGDVTQEDAVELKGVCGPPTGNKGVINEQPMPLMQLIFSERLQYSRVVWRAGFGVSLATLEAFRIVLNQDSDSKKPCW